jgi:hypothetical protein
VVSQVQHHKAVTAFIVALFIFVTLMMTFYVVESLLADETAKRFHLWFQFICGDWPQFEETFFPRKSLEFAAALTGQLLLALGPVGGVIALFWYLASFERRNFMTLMEALRIRDRMIKTQFLGKIPPESRQKFETDLNDAYTQAERRWAEQQLPNLIGYDRAKWIIDRIEKEQI